MESRIESNIESKSYSSYSWERRPQEKSSSHLWRNNSSNSTSNPNTDQLFVFGYSCKLFRDDIRAEDMDCGKHLIPWMGSNDMESTSSSSSSSLLIDRFDVRGYLNDLKQYEHNRNVTQQLTQQELEIERLCDEERFADLRNQEDMNHEEEEIKRFHAALADGKDYNQMDYKYDNSINTTENAIQCSPQKEDEQIEDNDRFKLPSGLSPPEDIFLPESQKLHNIIEKTASFVSKHGTQMEIIVKTKQSSNKNFDFLSFDSQLNPYYRFLLSSIKSGKYIPKQTENSDKSDSDDSDDDNYLHPSLLGSKSGEKHSNEPFNIPNLLRATNNHDSYSQLVKSFKDNFPTNEEVIETTKPLLDEKLPLVKTDSQLSEGNNGDKNCVVNATQPLWSSLLPSPPPEIEVIIEKLAQHVAKNGEQFELSIRKLGETRFEFVNPGNIYHAYYIRRKLHHLEENRKVQAIQLKMAHKKTANRSDSHTPKAPVSFSISAKDSKSSAQIGTSDESILITGLTKRDDERNSNSEINAKRICENALKDKLAYAARDRIAKEKQLQEERKRKAAVFLSLIKKQAKEQPKSSNSNDKNSENSSAYGPELPKSKPNDSQQLSPTIVAVTSPDNSPNIHKYNDNESSLLDNALSLKGFETAKSGSLLPFIVSDKPLKESSSRLSPPHRHHSYKRSSSHKKSYKRKRSRSPKHKSRHSSKSRSPPSSRSPSHSHEKYSKDSSKSRSRSRSRSHSRSHKRH